VWNLSTIFPILPTVLPNVRWPGYLHDLSIIMSQPNAQAYFERWQDCLQNIQSGIIFSKKLEGKAIPKHTKRKKQNNISMCRVDATSCCRSFLLLSAWYMEMFYERTALFDCRHRNITHICDTQTKTGRDCKAWLGIEINLLPKGGGMKCGRGVDCTLHNYQWRRTHTIFPFHILYYVIFFQPKKRSRILSN